MAWRVGREPSAEEAVDLRGRAERKAERAAIFATLGRRDLEDVGPNRAECGVAGREGRVYRMCGR